MERVHPDSGEQLSAGAFSIQSCVDMLHMNKRVAREEGLADLVAALEVFVPADEIDCRYDQALDSCFSFLGTGSAKERKDAYRAIGIYALTVVGTKAQTLLDRLFDLDRLCGMSPSSASDAERAVAAVNCLAAVTLVCAKKKAAAAKRSLKAVWEVIEETAVPQVLAAAMSAWTLLLPKAGDLGTITPPFKVIAKLLRADDSAVRMAAGQALAVCVELNHLPHHPDERPAYYYYYRRPEEPKPEDRPLLETRVAELADGGDVAHKKERAEEIILFRQIKDLLEANPQGRPVEPKPPQGGPVEPKPPQGGPCPEQSWSWSSGGCRVKVRTWAKLVQLNFLRRYLGEEGFDAHFQLNRPLFRDSLGFNRAAGGAEEEDLPVQEKKQLRNDNDKQRTKDINKDRRNKNKQYD